MRLISAHCSTPTPRLLLARADAQARVRTRPDAPDPAPGGSLFDRRRRVSIQAAPTNLALSSQKYLQIAHYGTEGHRFESCRARWQGPAVVGAFWLSGAKFATRSA